jgi:Flp pilus assembly protein TadD
LPEANPPGIGPRQAPVPRLPRRGLVVFLIGAGLALLTLLVYWPTFHYPFVNYDDPEYVSRNQHVQAGLSADGVRWAFTTFACGNWHPLTWLSLQLDHDLYGGLNAGGFHLTNVLLHTANAILLFLVLARMTGAVWRSAVVAALFALHPLHVEAVAWVTARKDVLSTLFWMLALAVYLSYTRRPGVLRYLLMMVALALGLLAKPMLVTLPAVLLLLDYWPLGRWPKTGGGRLLAEKIPLFVLVLASCAVTYYAQLHGEAVAPLEAFPLTERIENALLAYAGYLGKTLWPTHLAVFYPHPGSGVSAVGAVAAGLLLAVITALVLGPGRGRPYLAVGWLWFLGTLVPVIGLVQVGGQALADRYTYVPLVGLFVLLTWGAADLAAAYRLPGRFLAAAAGGVLTAFAVLTWVQVGYWKSTLDLWAHAAAVTDRNVLAHVNLGVCLRERGRLTAARREFEKAVAINPRLPEPHANLGNLLGALGLWQRATAEYRTAVALDPGNALLHFSLANGLAALGRHQEALAEYRTAATLDPASPWPANNRGSLLRDLGRLEEAEAEFRRAIVLDPRYAPAHNNLGIVLAELGRHWEARHEFRWAVALDPKDPQPHHNLARVLREGGRLDEALAEFRRAVALGDRQTRAELQACARLKELRPRLPALVAGRTRPADIVERLAFADLCRLRGVRRYALAARLYAEAFRADPDLRAANRFHAAAAAAAAGCGQGRDGARLGRPEKALLRQQALDWLREELTFWKQQTRKDSAPVRMAVQRAMRSWQRDPDLAGVRDRAALARLPGQEREAWRKLWQKATALLARAAVPRPPFL